MNLHLHDEVKIFIRKLPESTSAKVVHNLELLTIYGNLLGMPHAKKINSRLWELRVRGQQEVRIFYCIKLNTAYVLHGIIKKSPKIPSREISTALKRCP